MHEPGTDAPGTVINIIDRPVPPEFSHPWSAQSRWAYFARLDSECRRRILRKRWETPAA